MNKRQKKKWRKLKNRDLTAMFRELETAPYVICCEIQEGKIDIRKYFIMKWTSELEFPEESYETREEAIAAADKVIAENSVK